MENKESVISLKAKDGTLYTVRVTFKDVQQTQAKIVKVLKVEPTQTGEIKILNGIYQNENGWPLKVEGESLSLVKAGVAPLAKRVPLKGIAKKMNEARNKRKAEISEARMNGEI